MSIKLTSPTPSIVKPITKKRQSCACDGCRASKKRCDGELPCARCKRTGKICTYSKLRSKTTLSQNKEKNLPLCIRKETSMSELATTRRYFELYFESVNPIRLFSEDIQIEQFNHPTSKAQLFQYNAILASATRLFANDSQAHLIFENRARQLAGELMDDFTFDTALGFELLTFHYWGQDSTKASHYRDLTISLCKRIYDESTNPKKVNQSLRLLVGVSGMRDINKPTQEMGKIAEKFGKLCLESEYPSSGQVGVYSSFNDKELLTWVSLRTKLADVLFRQEKDNINPFKEDIDIHEFADIQMLVDKMGQIMARHFTSENNKIVHVIIHSLLRSFLLFAGRKKGMASAVIKKAMDILEVNQELLGLTGPYFISFLHIAFRIAFIENDIILANRISGYQRKLTEIMPSGKKFMEEDMMLLKTVASSPPSLELNQMQYPSLFSSMIACPIPQIATNEFSSAHFFSSPQAQFPMSTQPPTHFALSDCEQSATITEVESSNVLPHSSPSGHQKFAENNNLFSFLDNINHSSQGTQPANATDFSSLFDDGFLDPTLSDLLDL